MVFEKARPELLVTKLASLFLAVRGQGLAAEKQGDQQRL